MIGWLLFAFIVLSVLMKDDGTALRAKNRRARLVYRAAKRQAQYDRLPPMVRVINEERRWKRARRSALAAVTWALGCDEWTRDEIAGSLVKVLHKDKALVFDHDALHKECLAVLQRATCQ
jgi:hypothetical protein